MSLTMIQSLETAFLSVLGTIEGVNIRQSGARLEEAKGNRRNVQDYPSLELESKGTPTTPTVRTFGMMNPATSNTFDYPLDVRVVFDLILKTESKDADFRKSVIETVRQKLYGSLYPHMGITAFKVVRAEIGTSSGRQEKAVYVSRIPLTFWCRPMRSQVTA